MPYLKIALSTDAIALDNIRYSNKLESVAEKIDTDIVLESAKYKQDLPDSLLARKQFWQSWADSGYSNYFSNYPLVTEYGKSSISTGSLGS